MESSVRTKDIIIAELRLFRTNLEYAPGHAHLYEPFDRVVAGLGGFRAKGGVLDEELAREILTTVDLLLKENTVGRRPWTGNWETYFGKCMANAHRLLSEFSEFANYRGYCPAGYCNRFLEAFEHMDHHDQHYEERYPEWSRHFGRLALLAAEMFSLVTDQEARIEEKHLEHPDDTVFVYLLTGYARSRTPEAQRLLLQYLRDDEEWVRNLARRLLDQYFCAQQCAPVDADKPRR